MKLLRSNVEINESEYYTVGEINQLRKFVMDNIKILRTRKLSTINKKIKRLIRKH